jgi:hypothetical protein
MRRSGSIPWDRPGRIGYRLDEAFGSRAPLLCVCLRNAQLDACALLVAVEDLVRSDLQREVVDQGRSHLKDHVSCGLKSWFSIDASTELVALVANISAEQPGRIELKRPRASRRSGHSDRHKHSIGAVLYLTELLEDRADCHLGHGDLAVIDPDWLPNHAVDHLKLLFLGIAQPQAEGR